MLAKSIGDGVVVGCIASALVGIIGGAAVGFLGGRAVSKLSGMKKDSANAVQASTTFAGICLGSVLGLASFASKLKIYY